MVGNIKRRLSNFFFKHPLFVILSIAILISLLGKNDLILPHLFTKSFEVLVSLRHTGSSQDNTMYVYIIR